MNTDRNQPAANLGFITLAVMLATFIEVLDSTIANVALNHIAGSLSVSSDESTWVLTTYLISNAIVIPSTAWFGQKFGRKRFLIISVAIFTLASLFCGLATSLPMLLLMRIIQGAGGGALMPISQAILMESYPKDKQGQAMGIYGLGVVVAPVLGPVLGGWITDNYTWRWIFFINIPVGLLAIALIYRFVHDPVWIRDARPAQLDVIGFCFMSMWLGCQEVLLDKGQEDDWFGSHYIVVMTLLAVIGLIVFVVRELRIKKPFVDLRVMENYNFTLSMVLMFFAGVFLYALNAAIPLYLESLMGYTALWSGLAMISRGFGSMIAMPLAGKLVNRIQGRWLVAFGFISFGASSWALSRITLDISPWALFWPMFISGFSMGFMFVPLNTLALGSLQPEKMGNASGVLNLMRNVGGSVGISLVTTFSARFAQAHQTTLVSHLTPYDPAYQSAVRTASGFFAAHADKVTAQQQTLGSLYNQLLTQASMLAYLDIFRWFGLLCLICVGAALIMKKVKVNGPLAMH